MKGIFCKQCTGNVDSKEYDFTRDMCKECVEEMELRAERRKTLFGALEETTGGQMVIGGLKNAR